ARGPRATDAAGQSHARDRHQRRRRRRASPRRGRARRAAPGRGEPDGDRGGAAPGDSTMTRAIDLRHDTNLAGWPFWASLIAHLVGSGAMSAVAARPAAPPPPVPIELVHIAKPEPPVPAEAPKPKPVKAPVLKRIFQQPMTAPVPASSEPPALLDD